MQFRFSVLGTPNSKVFSAPFCQKQKCPALISSKRAALNTTAVVSVLGFSLLGFDSVGHTQVVPLGCSPSPAVAGGTVTCLAPPTPIDGILTNVDDFTLNIGDAATPTAVENLAGDGINQSGNVTKGFLWTLFKSDDSYL